MPRINWSNYPGDPPEPRDPPEQSIEVCDILEAEGVKQEAIDKVCKIVEELCYQANAECPQCEQRRSEEERKMYEATSAAAPSPPQDPRDSDEATIKRLKAAWDIAFKKAMENGAKYQQAMAALRVAREALEEAMSHLDWIGYGDNYERDCAIESKLPDKLDLALSKIKELMGE